MSPGIVLLSAILNGLDGALRAPTPGALVGLGLFVGLTWSVVRYVLRHVPIMRPVTTAGRDNMASPAS